MSTRFEFNRLGRLGAVTQKVVDRVQLNIQKIIPTKFQLNPYSGFEGIVSSRFEFNRRRCLGAVTQKLSNQGTIRNILTKFQVNPFSGL